MRGLLVAEAARLLNRHPNTVRLYCDRGLLQAKRDYRGYRVIALREVQRLRESLAAVKPDSGPRAEGESRNVSRSV